MTRLCQIVAVEKGLKARTSAKVTEVYHTLQKPQLFSGISRTYTPKDDDGDRLPAESTLVQCTVDEELNKASMALIELFDVTATKDLANTRAEGTVRVGEQALVTAPVPYLLFLDKQLIDFRTMISKLPVLDPSEVWERDQLTGETKTKPVQTVRTRKVPKVLVRYEATDKHPAQTEVYNEDVTVGTWTTVKLSGAITVARREELLKRVNTLIDAVKHAVEEANQLQVEQQYVGETLFSFLLDR